MTGGIHSTASSASSANPTLSTMLAPFQCSSPLGQYAGQPLLRQLSIGKPRVAQPLPPPRQSPGDIRSRADESTPQLCHVQAWSSLLRPRSFLAIRRRSSRSSGARAPSHLRLVATGANDFLRRNCRTFRGHTMRVDIRLEAPFSTLAQAIPTCSHSRSTDSPDLDESEVRRLPRIDSTRRRWFWRWIQKGVLQISKGPNFLHQFAKLVHANLTPWTVLINDVVSLSRSCIVACDLILTLG